MHEVALAQEIVAQVEAAAREHDARRVLAIKLEVGELSCVVPAALEFAFEITSKGTLAEGAALTVEREQLQIACPGCGFRGPVPPREPSCPRCGATGAEITGGRALRVVSIDIDDGATNGATDA